MPRDRAFLLVAAAGLVSWSGDFVLGVGLPFFAFRLTGSALATGLMLASAFLPGIVLGSVAGVFVDRWDRRQTMIACDVARALAYSLWFIAAVLAVVLLRPSRLRHSRPAES
jgi:MFS family permease